MLSTILLLPLAASVSHFHFGTDLFYFFVTYCLFTKLLLAKNNEELAAGYFRTAQTIKTHVSVRKFLRIRDRKWVLIFKIKDGDLPGLSLLLSKVSWQEGK